MNLTKREKHLAALGLAVLIAAILFQIFAKPALSRIRTLRRVIPHKQETLEKLNALSREYNGLKNQLQRIQKASERQENADLLSFVERTQKDCDLTDNVAYIKPATAPIGSRYEENTVEVKFQAVTRDQLIRFLANVESASPTVGVRSVDVRTDTEKSGLLDVTLRLVGLPVIKDT